MSSNAGHLAQVHDLAAARRRRVARLAGADARRVAAPQPGPGTIPDDVWAEVQAANELFEELLDDGRQIVFDDGHLDGRLVIELCDLEGRVLRSVDPGEIVGATDRRRHEGGDAA